MLTVGSLFSGIGGIDLGLERTGGFRTSWFAEVDAFCSRVLHHHWPHVPNLGDVRAITGARDVAHAHDAGREELRGPGPVPSELTAPERGSDSGGTRRVAAPVDVLAGGFPCQPVSLAGKRRGQFDERWLWPEFARLVGQLRPRVVLVENVPGLASKGLRDVVEDLAALRYDAEWQVVSAASVGAPHLRERIFVVAYPADTDGPELLRLEPGRSGRPGGEGSSLPGLDGEAQPLADADDGGRHGGPRLEWSAGWAQLADGRARDAGLWALEPDVGRVAHGVPDRSHRLRALGNGVVPQVAEFVGHLILEAIEEGRL